VIDAARVEQQWVTPVDHISVVAEATIQRVPFEAEKRVVSRSTK
jgi:hypothetical protein